MSGSFHDMPPEHQARMWKFHQDLTVAIVVEIKKLVEDLPGEIAAPDVISSIVGTMTAFVTAMMQDNGMTVGEVQSFLRAAALAVLPMRRGDPASDCYAKIGKRSMS